MFDRMRVSVLKITVSILTLMVTLCLCGTALAQSNDPPTPEPVILTDEQAEYPLGLHLEILEDPSGELSIEDVSSAFDLQFTLSQEEVPNLGLTDSAYWLRIKIQNETIQTAQWLLEVAFANIHFIDLYTPLPGGEGFAVKQTGIMRPPATRDYQHPHYVFSLTIPAQSQQTIYLRIKSGASTVLPINLWEPTTFFNQSQSLLVLQVLLFGALLGLLIYNLFLLFSFREASYLYLVICIANIIFYDLTYTGYLELYIFPNFYFLRSYYILFSFALIFVSMILFSDAFLELKKQLPKIHRLNIAILGVWGVLMLLIPFFSYRVLAILMAPYGIFSLGMVLVTGILSWRHDFRPARFFIIAWAGLILVFILILLVRLGFVPSSVFSENAYRFGWVWMAVCWSFALADHINLLKANTEAANRDLRNSEYRLSQILDGLPFGVSVYDKDQKPKYVNRRTVEILSNPEREIQVDISAERTLAQALSYFSFQVAGSNQEYPLERLPVHAALRGEAGFADDIEADLVDRRVPLEVWASPIRNKAGDVESAVVAFQDITQRKQAENELGEYRQHLERLVEERTAELSSVNKQMQLEIEERKELAATLQMRLEWLSAINLVNQVTAQSADSRGTYEKIIEIINELFSVEDSFILEYDNDHAQFKIQIHSCQSDLHANLKGSVTALSEPVLLNPNIKEGKLAIFTKDQFSTISGPLGTHFQVTEVQTIALVPLMLRGNVIGFLGLEMCDPKRVVTPEETTLLNIFSHDIAKIIEDRELFEDAKALITAEERNRLARDLHDSVTQVLFSATLLAEVLPKIWRRNPEQGLQRLEKLRRLTRGALAEMRTMLIELRPLAVIHTPLDELLSQLTEAIASRSDLPFQLYIERVPNLPEEVQTSFYRIAQEALNNIVKHAQAKLVYMSLSATPLKPDSTGEDRYEITLVVKDDGVGFSPGEKKSDQLGISIMQERAAAIQASFSLESKPGYGTKVIISWRNGSGTQNE